MSPVFVVDACRTPIGKVKGALAEVRPDHLAAGILKALIARNGNLDVTAIDDVYWGAANQAGEDNRNKGAITLEELAAKRPAFRKGGSFTGGNSSPLNDGAAALLLMSQEAVNRTGVTPLARYVGAAAAGVHPDYMGIGPVPAMNRVLSRAGWRIEDLDLVELNEAFAAQSVACVDELKLDQDKVNVNGGAIAIGHPLGRADRHHAAARDAPPRRYQGRGCHVHRRRPGHYDTMGRLLTERGGLDNFCYLLDNC